MKKQEAKNIIQKTFENKFDKKQFDFFIRNLLKENYEKKEFSYQGNIIPQAYQGFINKLERLGQYTDNEDNVLDILAVRLDKKHSINHARVSQRNFIRWYLNGSRGGQLKDGALVAFYLEDSNEWRFSFVKMQYSLEKQKDEFTPAKRYSYLVGKDEGSHTAQNQLIGLLQNDKIPTLEELENAFSIGKVTDRFFNQYKELFIKLKETIDNALENNQKAKKEFETKNIKSADFAKKTLGQIVFLYFLQKKGWLGVKQNQKWGQGNRRFFTSLYKTCIDKDQNFFNDYLKLLFYDALANERKETKENSKDYYKLFDSKIPFLNGGLFEPMNEYDWENINLIIPNTIFSNNTLISNDEAGTGILDVFKRYNFTVKEDEPLDTEVAVDPEMLGKVFENLLDVTDRKSKGAFYTPREIVHYMCSESLINYIDTELNDYSKTYQELGNPQMNLFGNEAKTGQQSLEIAHQNIKVPKEDIETFIHKGALILENEKHVVNLPKETKTYKFKLAESIRQNAKKIDKALENVKICDPAIGSGAFPVGLLHEIVTAREVINSYLNKDISTYELKRHAIYESIYGVDIEQSAVDIAKLRLWLSLIVDEQDYENIKPLPNLDYKIVCGNSLIGLPHDIIRDKDLEPEIEKLKDKFFNITDKDEKHNLRIEINSKIKQLLQSAEQFISYKINFDFRLWFSEVFNKYPAESKEVEILNAQIRALNTQVDAINKALKLKGEDEIIKLKIVSANQQISIAEIEVLKIKNRISNIYGKILEVDDNIVSEPENYSYQISALNKNIEQLNKKIAELNPKLKKNMPDSGGFDIVIGNPPYVQIQKFSGQAIQKTWEKQKFETYTKTGDIYSLFYEKGNQILKQKGKLAFITSNKWMRANYGEKTRKYFAKNTNPLFLIDFGGYKVFDNATVDTNILMFENAKNTNNLQACNIKDDYKKHTDIATYFGKNSITLKKLTEDSWIILSPEEQKIKERIEKIGTPLKDWDISINYGIKTGFNEAFIIDGKKKDELIAADPKNAEIIKPVLRGRDIKRYKAEFADLWLINTHNGVKAAPLITKNIKKPYYKITDDYGIEILKPKAFEIEPININEYPVIKKHLNNYYDKLKTRQDKGITFYNLRNCAYIQEFEKEKVVWASVGVNEYCFVEKGFLLLDTNYFAVGLSKYHLALLNSKLIIKKYIEETDTKVGTIAYRHYKYNFEKIPIPKIPKQQQKPFVTLVDYILFLKSQELEDLTDKLIPVYFEQIIDGMVYELYFPDLLKKHNREIIKHLPELPEFTDNMQDAEKLEITKNIFNIVDNKEHPIRKNLFFMNSIEEIKTIEDSLKS